MQHTSVSYFSRKERVVPDCSVNLLSICTTNQYKDQIELLRSYPKGSAEYLDVKNALPCFTPSITCSVRRQDGVLTHTHKIALDFDNVTSPDCLKQKLSQLEFIEFAALSCSGAGVFAIVPIKEAGKHRQYFDALVRYFAQENIVVDKSGSDITRCRFVSYDANYYYNANASQWDNVLSTTQLFPQPSPKILSNSINKAETLIYAIHDYVVSTHIDITQGRTNWLVIASFIAQTLGEAGRSIFHDISQYHPDYDSIECDRCYVSASCYTVSIGIGAIANILRHYPIPSLKVLLSPMR